MPDDDETMTPVPRGSASGVGSMPGTDVGWALRVVRDELAAPAAQGDGGGVPFLPELPARGPGADLVGRAAARLVDLPVDLQPSGWRLVDRPGRDLARAAAYWREDLDRLAEAFDGWDGPLKVQLAGPWTLSATVWLPRGERAVTDTGARRDLVASTAEAVRQLLVDVRGAVPGAQPVLQLDEPSLPAVLDGALSTASGLHRVRSVPGQEVAEGLAAVVRSARQAGAPTVVHCCADDPPVALLVRSGADALNLDASLLGGLGWESMAAAVEGGCMLWAGAVPAGGPAASADEVARRLARSWRDVGLPVSRLADVVVTPACGLAASSQDAAAAAIRTAVRVRRQLAERAAD
jgi:methionine synthase II (cobalamin-independent)